MHCGEDDSPPYITSYRNGPYSCSLVSSASSSDPRPQSSNSTNSNPPEAICCISQPVPTSTSVPLSWSKQKLPIELATEQRHHLRRIAVRKLALNRFPALVRQSDRKLNFVDSLVDSSTQIVEAIWPLSSVACRSEMGNKGVLPLRTFIQETLRRSRTSYSTLQVALYYLILIKPYVPEHNFTMEQPDGPHSVRALQCGRRMFLSALILASKYLQDRNYSARSWSKISGLNTLEINQNEMAFLLAINWKLHITDTVFKRWTDIVLTYTPSQPLSPAAVCPKLAKQTADWKAIILKLNSNLDTIEESTISISANANVQLNVASPQSLDSLTVERSPTLKYGSIESIPTPKYYMEPPPSSIYPSSKPTPVLGLLPTPRLTPQSTGFYTPTVSTTSYILYKPVMDFATAPVSSICAAQVTDNWYSSSSQAYVFARQSSLANSASSMSSPESMISDSSLRLSLSSSISSASSLTSAPILPQLDVPARCQYAGLCRRKQKKFVISTGPEGYCDKVSTSLPESYTGPVGKDFFDVSLDMQLARCPPSVESLSRFGAKRSRPESFDQSLQENVPEMLNSHFQSWSADLIRSRMPRNLGNAQVTFESTSSASLGQKRLRCALEATRGLPRTSLHPGLGGFGGLDM